ncbi:MAG: hypothetical protein LBH65_00980 [Desulfovibrio sp.]|jgi:hypothetical protein|nr:hypothetical protein [Desulfovibrio sp.]
MSKKPFDQSTVRFVKRITVGSTDPARPFSEEDAAASLDTLNRCLSESPSGYIMGTEKNFTVMNVGEHQIVMQWIVYHVGFTRKPLWLG